MANPYWDILGGVSAAMDAALAAAVTAGLITVAPPTDIRYEITDYDPAIETLPLIIIAPSAERQHVVAGTFESQVIYDYPVDIVWLEKSGRLSKTGLEAYLQTEHVIQTALYTPLLAGVESVWDTNDGPLVAAKLPQSPYRVRAWQMKYRIVETGS